MRNRAEPSTNHEIQGYESILRREVSLLCNKFEQLRRCHYASIMLTTSQLFGSVRDGRATERPARIASMTASASTYVAGAAMNPRPSSLPLLSRHIITHTHTLHSLHTPILRISYSMSLPQSTQELPYRSVDEVECTVMQVIPRQLTQTCHSLTNSTSQSLIHQA